MYQISLGNILQQLIIFDNQFLLLRNNIGQVIHLDISKREKLIQEISNNQSLNIMETFLKSKNEN